MVEMSFVTSPVIDRWNKEGKSWHVVFQPYVTPLPIPPLTDLQMPLPTPIPFQSAEGTLINFGACFDNPLCGLRLETAQGIDTAHIFTVANSLIVGIQPQGLSVTIAVPPVSAPGHFCINVAKEQTWKKWCRLYVINVDIVPHNAVVIIYTMAMLDQAKP